MAFPISLRAYLDRDRFPLVFTAILYVMSYGLGALFLSAMYWDDWTSNVPRPQVILQNYRESGFVQIGYMHVLLRAGGPVLYHLLTFVMFFAMGVLLWHILRSIAIVALTERNLIAILFVMLPFFAARAAAIATFAYTCAAFLFFVAWLLLIQSDGREWKMPVAAALFVASFSINSLLAFYLLPFIHLSWLLVREGRLPCWRRLLTLAAFAALPFAFFMFKLTFQNPYGTAAGYNQLRWNSIRADAPVLLVGLVCSVFALRMAWWSDSPRVRALVLLPIGAWIFWLAVFPYRAIGIYHFGDEPWRRWWEISFFTWYTRHSLLMPLGTAIVIVLVDRIMRVRGLPWLALVMCALSVEQNVRVTAEYYVDWIKQREVIAAIAASDVVRQARTILVEDQTSHFNARHRRIGFYEYNGWLKRAFGDEKRLMLGLGVDWFGSRAVPPPENMNPYFTEMYLASEYVRGAPDVLLTISAAKGRKQTLLTGHGGFSITTTRLR